MQINPLYNCLCVWETVAQVCDASTLRSHKHSWDVINDSLLLLRQHSECSWTRRVKTDQWNKISQVGAWIRLYKCFCNKNQAALFFLNILFTHFVPGKSDNQFLSAWLYTHMQNAYSFSVWYVWECCVAHLLLSGDGGLPLFQRGQQLRDLQLEALLWGRPVSGHLRLDSCYLGLDAKFSM